MSHAPKHFTNVRILKRIDFQLLTRFLKPYRDYLENQRNMPWSKNAKTFPYDFLSAILMTPDTDSPQEMIDALFFVDKMASEKTFDLLQDKAEEAGVRVPQDTDPASLALMVWLEAPELLEKLHAETLITKAKRFEVFCCASKNRKPNLSKKATLASEEEMNDWFETRKKGRGTKMFSFQRGDDYWFLFRHGERMKREGAIEQDGESSSVHYRPETFDVLIYHSKEGELEINTKNKGERKKYCQVLSEHLFGDPGFIPYEETQRFTLQPLLEGPDCLVCADVPGMEWVQLREVDFVCEGVDKDYHNILKTDSCLFDTFDNCNRSFPKNAEPVKASFRIFFSELHAWRTVVVYSSNSTSFDREADHRAVKQLLLKRGFLKIQKEIPSEATPS